MDSVRCAFGSSNAVYLDMTNPDDRKLARMIYFADPFTVEIRLSFTTVRKVLRHYR